MKTWRNIDAFRRRLDRESDSTDPDDKSRMLLPISLCQWMADKYMATDESGSYYMKPEGESRLVVGTRLEAV